MMFFKGFLFGFGFILGTVAVVIFIIFFFKLKKKKIHATAKDWKEYLKDALANDDYAEAKFVTELILGKNDDDIVVTPENYKVLVDRDIVFDETQESISKLKVNQTFKILKQKNGKQGD